MARRLRRHPEPPRDLAQRTLPLIRLTGPFYRIHRKSHDALHFGTSGLNRFDAPQGDFGVLYAATDVFGAFVETAGHRTGVRFVQSSWLAERALSEIVVREALLLVNLRGPNLARLGADGRLVAGEHMIPQRWSRALWSHPRRVDGLSYVVRHDLNRGGLALFSRARRKIRARLIGELDDPAMGRRLSAIMNRYGFGVSGPPSPP